MGLGLVSIAVINAVTKTNLERKDLFHLTIYSFPGRKVRAGTWRQKLKQKPWNSAAFWFAQTTLLHSQGHLSTGCTIPVS